MDEGEYQLKKAVEEYWAKQKKPKRNNILESIANPYKMNNNANVQYTYYIYVGSKA